MADPVYVIYQDSEMKELEADQRYYIIFSDSIYEAITVNKYETKFMDVFDDGITLCLTHSKCKQLTTYISLQDAKIALCKNFRAVSASITHTNELAHFQDQHLKHTLLDKIEYFLKNMYKELAIAARCGRLYVDTNITINKSTRTPIQSNRFSSTYSSAFTTQPQLSKTFTLLSESEICKMCNERYPELNFNSYRDNQNDYLRASIRI